MPSVPRRNEGPQCPVATNELPMSEENRHPFGAGASLSELLTQSMSESLSAEQVADLLCLAGKGTYRSHARRANNPYIACTTVVQVQNIAKQEGEGRKLVRAGVEAQVGTVLRAILALCGSKVAVSGVEMLCEAKHFIEFRVWSTGPLPLVPRENTTYPVVVDRKGVHSFGVEHSEELARYALALKRLLQKTRHYLADRLPVQCVRIKVREE